MRAVERHARTLLECFRSVGGDDLRRASALVFLHELAEKEWEGSAPPPGHDWGQITGCPDDHLAERLSAALEACSRRWPGQILDHEGLFHGLESRDIRAAVDATEILTRSPASPGEAFGGRAEFLSEVYMSTRGRSAQSMRGEFYTPLDVAVAMAKIAGPSPGEWVVDRACGTGNLLLGAFDDVRRELGLEAARTITMVGVDLSVAAVELCRLQLILAGAEADQFWIFSGDSLRQPIVGRAHDGELYELSFHQTLANPPFGKGAAGGRGGSSEVIPLVVPDQVLNRRIRASGGLQEEMLARGLVRTPEASEAAQNA